MGLLDWASAALIGVALLFFIAGTLGLLRLPDPVSRLHALTKADNLGLVFLVLGLLPSAPSLLYGAKLVLVWLLVLAAGATGAHLIAKRSLCGDEEGKS
jgi:multicomponent Na+:H+ antiporter subunit G